MKTIHQLSFYIKNRFILFVIALLIFIGFNWGFTGQVLPTTETKDLWFYSGLFMVLFSILFIEPYYTSPKNVITNTIPLLLVLLSIKSDFISLNIWWILCGFSLSLLILSIIALALEDKDKSPGHIVNRVSDRIKNIVVLVGHGKVIYSIIFISFIFLYRFEFIKDVKETYFLVLILLWGLVLLINPKNLHNKFSNKQIDKSKDALGEIFGVQSKKIFLVKLFDDRKSIKKFEVVKFRYSMQDSDDYLITGIIFDTYLLNQEKWAKILQLGTVKKEITTLPKNVVYKISNETERSDIEADLNIENFIGVVIEGSKIGTIKFEYSKKVDDLQEGDLVELKTGNKRLFYQVISGITANEKLENKNETGFVEGEAIQLGEWVNIDLSFQKFGWVPTINTPIFKASTTGIKLPKFSYPEFVLGTIPKTELPSIINLHDAISHHTALIGVTGSGKSFIAREIIKELLNDTKVICVDFTGEYIEQLKLLNPVKLIVKDHLPEVEEMIAKKEAARDKVEVLRYKRSIQEKLGEYVDKYMGEDGNLAVFELPDLSNTSFILEFTQLFLESIFLYAKKNEGNRICIVLEEAHTIIPETSFLGDLGDFGSSKALVSKMSQIALQGRKYGVGFLVIAQRTANVSKTVLTQCNTIICFQAFDETSFNFLSNYVGKNLVQTLPNLHQYHAIVTGKGIKSNIPMIINLEREIT